jgi:phosphoribosylamine---glycine ligase
MMFMKKNILIIGAGAREHAIGWKLRKSPKVGKLYFAPGNGGTAEVGENIAIAMDDVEGLLRFVQDNAIDFTVVGSEAPLSLGIVDRFEEAGLHIFGPTQKAAALEYSKAWASEFMRRHDLPVPAFRVCKTLTEARSYAKSLKGNCVIKADGLCQGKGVFVCDNLDEAYQAIDILMVKKSFGPSGEIAVIQEKLVGKEVSMMAFCDGAHAIPLVSAQDYKRIFDGDHGPNTGGMGSVAPANRVAHSLFKQIHRLLTLTVSAMRDEGIIYKGILYAGIMVTPTGPYILEFNCRFGDPETQSQLPLLSSDLFDILGACSSGMLTTSLVTWEKKTAVCVVVASKGYPDAYVSGLPIAGLTKKDDDVVVFHAGTIQEDGEIKTHGGRVLSVVAMGENTAEAKERVYAHIESVISFDGMQYRKDIGN